MKLKQVLYECMLASKMYTECYFLKSWLIDNTYSALKINIMQLFLQEKHQV